MTIIVTRKEIEVSMSRNVLLSILFFTLWTTQAQVPREIINFEFEGKSLNGVLNMPEDGKPKGIVLIVHGSGRTNAVAQEWHSDVRETMVKAGYAAYMWDKMGCGKSEGIFDRNQLVQNSADEVIAAIHALKEKNIPGSDKIGLWGISRAGWINPLVIKKYKDIRFWISVSGVDEKENFKYLLGNNLRIDGHPKDSVGLLVQEWAQGNKIVHKGENFETYLQATKNLRKNRFMQRFSNGSVTEEGYYAFQKSFMKEAFEEDTGLQVYIEDFEALLSQVNCPVLALFGEKDMNVDWVKVKALYERTLGEHTDLTLTSFPDGNHNLFKARTGGFYEFEDDKLPYDRSEGFLKTMLDWLVKLDQF